MILKSISEQFIRGAEFRQLDQAMETSVPGKVSSIEGIAPSSFPLIAASVFNRFGGQVIAVAENPQKMQELYLDLTCFTDPDLIFTLPPWDTLPYEFVSPPENIERERITAIYRMIRGLPSLIVTAVESLVRKVPEKNYFTGRGVSLSVKEEYPFDDLVQMLADYGYTREHQVEAYGQFSVKGGIIDVYLPSEENPVRLDFFGDTLESIREFSAESQITLGRLESVTVYPRKEIVLLRRDRDKLAEILSSASAKGMDFPEEVKHFISGKEHSMKGVEDLFPLITKPATLLDFIHPDARIIMCEAPSLDTKKSSIEKNFDELYRRKKDAHLCLPPEELVDVSAFDSARSRAVSLQVFTSSSEALQWKLRSIPGFRGKVRQVREEIASRLDDGWKVVVTTGFEGQARRLYDLLGEFDPPADFESFDPSGNFSILISPLREGIELCGEKILVLSDHEIFGKSYRKKRFRKKSSRPIESFLDLKTGDYVVHINHGIGIFQGIERMTAGGVERDFLLIEYAEGDRLYVSLDQIVMVQKYIGVEGRKPRIDALGKKSAWNRIKEKVRESVEEIARELMVIYSKRNSMKGFQFPPDTQWQEEFESLFEYEETPDQITAIEDVKDDMENQRPMDRLVCGDVGFGKTEVAIRAAFKAAMAGRQTAILVPTTVLAMQHFSTFRKRFQEYPMEVEMMSRFRSAADIRRIKERLSKGEIDIIIGTHALLSKDIVIKSLGLLVIDEEQRFGVKHKERLKQMRAMVDVLTLSATPIPRTLHMSMAGMRDLSIITTPPENRQSIETFVMEENPDILRMAILREIERDGQVFFVHNRVQSIDAMASSLEKLVPEASFCVAHGQMQEHELEEIMIDFLNEKYDVLVSTSIIESGLDIPNVNTIVINRADTFGLSQLYQLKGRVGRSERKAHAYLFYPRHTPLSEEAQKRLQVISEYSDLGSGFKIAMKDLEIRGAGNILGVEQSGNIMDVGFDLYMQMLEEEVKKLKGEDLMADYRAPVFLKTDFFIPSEYIPDERQKIDFYKRFESCVGAGEVDSLAAEMTDRFGAPPPEVSVLIELERVRALASALRIDEILEDSRAIRIRMSAESKVDRAKLVKYMASDRRFSLDAKDRDTLLFSTKNMAGEKKISELKKWLQLMS